MREPLVAVVGPGALGGLLAARWASKGAGVFILGRDKTSENRWTTKGRITLVSRDGSRQRLRRGISSLRDVPRETRCSALFLCVKSGDMAAAIASCKPWVGPDTAVVGLQNGLGHEKLLRKAFGAERTVLGSCYIAADRPDSGTVAHTGGDLIWLAERSDNRPAAQTARDWLLRGGWTVRLCPSEDRLLWTKLCFNAATNPLATLCAASNGDLEKEPALREIMLTALSEAVAIARRSGHPPLFRDMAGFLLKAGRSAPHQRNSMLQDLKAGRPLELKAILGPLIKAGRKHGRKPMLLSRLDYLLGRLEKISAAGSRK